MKSLDHLVRPTRRLVLAGLGAGIAQAALANAPRTSIRPEPRQGSVPLFAVREVPELLAEAALGGTVSFVVADARTGKVLEARKARIAQPPASVTKAMTALYALDALGPGFRFNTRLLATGPLRNGRIEGDLVLAGGADPTLDTDALAELAAGLKAAGVREVRGRFLVHGGALPFVRAIDPGQPEQFAYNPSVGGLNLNFNRVRFEWKRQQNGYAVSMDARSRRYRPEVSMARMRIVNRSLPVYTYAEGQGVEEWTVAQAALGKGGARWLPVRKPALYAGEVFQILARSHGIVLPAPQEATGRARGRVLAEVVSDDLRAILQGMLRYSTNLTAEVVGLRSTQERVGGVSTLRASAAQKNRWLKSTFGIRSAAFVDHSGLGEASRINAADMVKTLVRVGPSGPLTAILKDIPFKDGDGKPIANHPVSVRAKTGTLNFVSGLAGYVRPAEGRELAFAIFTSDMDKRAAIRDEERDRPPGARSWTRRSRELQQGLLKRWTTLYAT